MPLIQVTMGKGRTVEEKRALLDAITQAAHETTGTPLRAIRVWINELEPEHLMIAGETLAERNAQGNKH